MTNMKTTHTPGPWIIDETDNLIHAADERHTIICHTGNLKNPEIRADASLISAAPELLAACQRFLNPTEEGPRLEDIIRAAVAKATAP